MDFPLSVEPVQRQETAGQDGCTGAAMELGAAVLAFATTAAGGGMAREEQTREHHHAVQEIEKETRAISRKQQLQSFLPQSQNRLCLFPGDTLKTRHQSVFHRRPRLVAKVCVTAGTKR